MYTCSRGIVKKNQYKKNKQQEKKNITRVIHGEKLPSKFYKVP